MTHAYFKFDRAVSWDECVMARYASNNCIVLLCGEFDNCLVLIEGKDLGIAKTDDDEAAFARAKPILKMALTLRNEAFARGVRAGRRAKIAEIKNALEER